MNFASSHFPRLCEIASMDRLPDELLALCAHWLVGDWDTLLALGLVSKRFNAIATRALYHTVTLSSARGVRNLASRLIAKGDLLSCVRRLTVEPNARHRLDSSILQNVPFLEHLDLGKYFIGSGTKDLDCFGSNSFSRLKSVTSKGGLTERDVLMFAMQPTLKHFSVHGYVPQSEGDQLELFRQPNTECWNLEFMVYHMDAWNLMKRLVEFRPAIGDLLIRIDSICDDSDAWIERISELLVSQILIEMIMPARHTLKALDIKHVGPIQLNDRDRRIDFSPLTSLEYLIVSAKLLFRAACPSSKRSGVWKILPRSIIFFSPLFERDSGFTFDTIAGKKLRPSVHMAPATYNWVTEILEHKAECFPDLVIITIQEVTRYEPYYTGNWIEEDWDIPARLSRLCRKTNVAVKATHMAEYPSLKPAWWTAIDE